MRAREGGKEGRRESTLFLYASTLVVLAYQLWVASLLSSSSMDTFSKNKIDRTHKRATS